MRSNVAVCGYVSNECERSPECGMPVMKVMSGLTSREPKDALGI